MTTGQNDFSGGHSPLTPPPAADASDAPDVSAASAASVPPSPERSPSADVRRSSGAKAIMVVTAIVGGLALLGSGGAAAAAATGNLLSSGERSDSVQSVDVRGIDSIELDASASNMRIEFGDVDEARLSVTNGRGSAWTFERDDDGLVVRSPDSRFGWWFGSWFGDEESAVLTLPAELQDAAVDADLTLNAGSLDVIGDFGVLDIGVSAGALDVEGSARALDVDMSAGRADVVLRDVTDVALGVSAGDLTVELTGTAPERTRINASAGSVDLTVPDETYTVENDVSAGSLDALIDQAAGSGRTIDVSLSAGSVTVRPGD